MSKIILDFGSGNTCRNNKDYIKQMYLKLKRVDGGRHEVVVKWQLFKVAGANKPLTEDSFDYAYKLGQEMGYQVTASVADLDSLNFLLNYDIPFVKIANNRSHDFLISYIPDEVPVYISKSEELVGLPKSKEYKEFWCIRQYPATVKAYEELPLSQGCCISDHTENFELFNKYNPEIIEWHYKLKYSTGLDAGKFARTPGELINILSDGKNHSS